MTVLFSDLVGWTEVSENLDAEVAREILAAYHQRCGAHVVALGGTVGQFLGDGILAYFGHPTAYEDNGYRAVLAGLRIVDEVGEVTRDSALIHGCELAVRVGIHSGLVVAEELSDDPLEPRRSGRGWTWLSWSPDDTVKANGLTAARNSSVTSAEPWWQLFMTSHRSRAAAKPTAADNGWAAPTPE